MKETKKPKKRLLTRDWIRIVCGVLVLLALKGKMSGDAKPGGYTALFDTVMLWAGSLGVFATLLWPKKKPPGE